MDYAIMRLSKIKTLSAFSGITRHDYDRDALPYRAHPERTPDNYHLRPSGIYTPDQTLQDRWRQRVGSQKIRKNAVFGYEVVLSFSPDATPRIPVDQWAKDSAQWLADNFGGSANILDIAIHLDETTPHVHAVICPLDDRGKLNARHYTGTRRQLSELQDSYAAAMSIYDLSRGVKFYETPERSRPHQDHRRYNAKIRQNKTKEKENHLEKSLRSHQIYKEISDHTTHAPLSR